MIAGNGNNIFEPGRVYYEYPTGVHVLIPRDQWPLVTGVTYTAEHSEGFLTSIKNRSERKLNLQRPDLTNQLVTIDTVESLLADLDDKVEPDIYNEKHIELSDDSEADGWWATLPGEEEIAAAKRARRVVLEDETGVKRLIKSLEVEGCEFVPDLQDESSAVWDLTAGGEETRRILEQDESISEPKAKKKEESDNTLGFDPATLPEHHPFFQCEAGRKWLSEQNLSNKNNSTEKRKREKFRAKELSDMNKIINML